MHVVEKYLGRVIRVDIERRLERWSWAYRIDGGFERSNLIREDVSEDDALLLALAEAKSEIDRSQPTQ